MKHAVALIAITLLLATSAQALTGDQVMNNENPDPVAAFMSGASDMYYVMAPHKAECARNWLLEQRGAQQAYELYEAYPDKPAAAILVILINRNCPDQPDQADGS